MTSARSALDGRRRPLVIIDTATAWVVAGIAATDGTLDGASTWPAEHRHGETLLPALGRLLGEQNVPRSGLAGVIVGTGPGAFTGLRVGIASAKGIAVGLGIPIVAVPTGGALLAAAEAEGLGPADELTLLLPAGPADRVVVRLAQPPRLLPAGTETDGAPATMIAVDLEGRAEAAAVERGSRARRGLPAALARLGAARLAERPGGDDLARLAPEYVTLPRGVTTAPGDDVALSVG